MFTFTKFALLSLGFVLICPVAQAQSNPPAKSLAQVAGSNAPAYIGRYENHPGDTEAIMQVTRDFQAALSNKDGKKLSGLLLNSRILFSSPASPDEVKATREKTDVHYDGIDVAGAVGFIRFISNTKQALEERFYNIKIQQDGHVAWVSFDYEFVENSRVQNYGVENWQMVKTPDRGWKIFSVTWSAHKAEK